MAVKTKAAKKTAPEPVQILSTEVATLELQDIVSNTAQSRGMGVLSRLYDMGYGMFEKISTDKDPIWSMLFSDKPEEQAFACNLIEENEGDVKSKDGEVIQQGIVSLARSQRNVQLEPVGVWDTGDGYDAIFGMRRIVARAYNYAKHGDSSQIEAKVFTFESEPTSTQLKLMALEENDNRLDESPIDRAITFKFLTDQGLQPIDIGKRIGKSDQYVRNYLKLLHPKLDDERMNIHTRKRSVESALKLLQRLKDGTSSVAADKKGTGAASTGVNRFRLPGVKGLTKILDAYSQPKGVRDELWAYYTQPVVRQFLCEALGLRYEPYVEKKEEESNGKERKPKGKVLKVKKARAVKLLVSLGKTNANTYSAATLKEKLEDAPNWLEEGQESEDPSLQKLLEKLLDGYKEGLTVEIVAE